MGSELNELFTSSIIQHAPLQVILNLTAALIIGLLIFQVYRVTHSGVLYSRSFNVTVLMITLVTSMVIMIISGNLSLSLGMVGALSIVRFRSAVKDPKDIAFLFWGIAVGLATGTGAYIIAVTGSVLIAIVMLLMNYRKFDENSYLLIIKGVGLSGKGLQKTIDGHTRSCRLRMTNQMDSAQEYIFEINLKHNQNNLIAAVRAIDTVDTVNLVTYDGEISS